MSQDIDIVVADEIQRIRFQRTSKKNAFTGAMYEAISAALDRGETDAGIAVHVFIGSGGSFSAGNDINDFMRRAHSGPNGIPAPSLAFIRRLPKVTKPMIAAVDGLAIGVGTTMLFHCDLVFATPAASLRTPFLDLGLVPEAASSLTAVQRMGYARAFELLCLGETYSAERALAAGIINAIVPAAELEETAMRAARRIAAKPRGALLQARRLMRGDGAALSGRIEEEAEAYRALLSSAEAQEAFAAFLEKRPADFAGLRRKT